MHHKNLQVNNTINQRLKTNKMYKMR